ncbi:MAG: TetR/AcrR family transcriptional regulator, partial [Treponema sp.]|nr:TetR/AcrR family transcriptional regulator [Treponema sp.]
DEKPYNKIAVSDITQKAGIARQTFYRNYSDKDDIVSEHLMQTINLELGKSGGGKQEDLLNNVILTFNFKYMIDSRENLKKMMSIVDVEHRIRNEAKQFSQALLEQYKTRFSVNEYLICRYKLYYQLVGCLQVFFDWFINDMPLPLNTVVSMLNAMNVPKTIQYRNIPKIVVQIRDDS